MMSSFILPHLIHCSVGVCKSLFIGTRLAMREELCKKALVRPAFALCAFCYRRCLTKIIDGRGSSSSRLPYGTILLPTMPTKHTDKILAREKNNQSDHWGGRGGDFSIALVGNNI